MHISLLLSCLNQDGSVEVSIKKESILLPDKEVCSSLSHGNKIKECMEAEMLSEQLDPAVRDYIQGTRTVGGVDNGCSTRSRPACSAWWDM